MTYILTIALGTLVMFGCSSSSQRDDPRGPGWDGGLDQTGGADVDGTGGTEGAGGTEAVTEAMTGAMGAMPLESTPRPAMSCENEGQRRGALPAERAEHCVCTRLETYSPDGGLTETLGWACYGPDPNAPTVGGSPDSCEAFYFDQDEDGGGNCLIIVSQCDDDHSYMLSCIDGRCTCLVDNIRTADLEPDGDCPLTDFKQLCGWALPVGFADTDGL